MWENRASGREQRHWAQWVVLPAVKQIELPLG